MMMMVMMMMMMMIFITTDQADQAYETLLNERKETNDKLLEAAKNKTKLMVLEKLCDEKSEKLKE